MKDGVYIGDLIADSLKEAGDIEIDFSQKISKILKFGIYDQYLNGQNGNIRVVSIVGIQSLGKSYVMNRFFGTRFNVSQARCTDGIWMSMSRV
jgi:hypothetical protein